MPAIYKGPKLWLRKAAVDRAAVWSVVDRSRRISTGFFEGERGQAEAFLRDYVERNYPRGIAPPTVSERLGHVIRGLVYFISTDEVAKFPIKIGYSTLAGYKQRMISLQIGCPYKLQSLCTTPGARQDELDIQRDFAHLLIRGEWFRRDPSLNEFIETLKRI